MVSDHRKIFLFLSLTVFPIVPISQTASFDHSILELNCLVHGDDPHNIFPVKIASTESVGTLKKAIKEEKKVTLEHIDADALKLWKVSIPVDAEYKENVGEVEFVMEQSYRLWKLYRMFSPQYLLESTCISL
jgi:hypothetical protein